MPCVRRLALFSVKRVFRMTADVFGVLHIAVSMWMHCCCADDPCAERGPRAPPYPLERCVRHTWCSTRSSLLIPSPAPHLQSLPNVHTKSQTTVASAPRVRVEPDGRGGQTTRYYYGEGEGEGEIERARER